MKQKDNRPKCLVLNTSTFGETLKRLGNGSKGNLVWLLQFAQMDLNKIGQEEKLRIREEVTLFGLIARHNEKFLNRYKNSKLKKLVITAWFLVKEIHTVTGTFFRQLFFERKLTKLPRIELHYSFLEIKTQFFLQVPHLKIVPDPPIVPWQKNPLDDFDSEGQYVGCTFISQKSIGEDSAFYFRMAEILGDNGDLITRCSADDCQKLFLKIDRRKIFCSVGCKSRLGMRLHRKTIRASKGSSGKRRNP